MTTVQSVSALADWLLADPAHIAIAAAVISAITPTPAAGSIGAKFYKILDILAINIGHAKETGAPFTCPPAAPAASSQQTERASQ